MENNGIFSVKRQKVLQEKCNFAAQKRIRMKTSHNCLLCLGSNVDAEVHLKRAEKTLDRMFPNIRWGKTVCTPPEGNGGKGPDYLNRIARFETELTEKEVERIVKNVEKENGRRPDDKQSGFVPLDIDLLQYGPQVLRPLDFGKEYVRKALQAFSEDHGQ